MKLARYCSPGSQEPHGSMIAGWWHDVSPLTCDIDAALLSDKRLAAVREATQSGDPPEIEPVRFGSAICQPGKVACIGLTYCDHADQTEAVIPNGAVVFMKPPDTMVGANNDLFIPKMRVNTGTEAEPAVVIGRTARYPDSEAGALACVAGCAISHDVSDRAFQLGRGGHWDKDNSCETLNPIGPGIVTADEVPDPQALGLRLAVNRTPREQRTTADMIFGGAEIIRGRSDFMVAHPADDINTGTPAGIAPGNPYPKPPLRAGDVVELEIDGLARQPQIFRSA